MNVLWPVRLEKSFYFKNEYWKDSFIINPATAFNILRLIKK